MIISQQAHKSSTRIPQDSEQSSDLPVSSSQDNILSPSEHPEAPIGKTKMTGGLFHREEKEILKGISIYFNPGELVGIMGPSGKNMHLYECSRTWVTMTICIECERGKGTTGIMLKFLCGVNCRIFRKWRTIYKYIYIYTVKILGLACFIKICTSKNFNIYT